MNKDRIRAWLTEISEIADNHMDHVLKEQIKKDCKAISSEIDK